MVRRVVPLAAGVLLAACSGDKGTGPSNAPGIQVVSGGAPVDTVDGAPRDVVVSVRTADGAPAANVEVLFTAPRDSLRLGERTVNTCAPLQPCLGLPYAPLSVRTDAAGTARAVLIPGTVQGRHRIEISTPSLGYGTSMVFAVGAGEAARVVPLAGRQAVELGATVVLTGAILDRYGNTLEARPSLTAEGSSAVLSFDPLTATARGIGLGTQVLTARSGFLTATTTVAVVPKGRLVVSTPTAEIWAMNTDGSQRRRIASVTGPNNDVTPVMSVTPSAILYSSNMDIVKYTEFVLASIDTSGGSRRVLRKEFGFNQPLAARTMPDGSIIVVGSAVSQYVGDWPILRIAPDNTITRLATITNGVAANSVVADLSPDGTQVVYCATIPGLLPVPLPTINVFDIRTGTSRVLTTACSSPRWSPDGQRIAFLDEGTQPGFAGRIAIMNADGTGRRLVATDRVGPGLSWSPDGEYLVSHIGISSRVIFTRVSDGVSVEVVYAGPDGYPASYSRPYWR